MLNKLVSSLFQTVPRVMSSTQLLSPVSPAALNNYNLTFVRTKIRYHFPRPSEVKRIKRHGWFARMSTPSGRKILMRRILKGRHVLSH